MITKVSSYTLILIGIALIPGCKDCNEGVHNIAQEVQNVKQKVGHDAKEIRKERVQEETDERIFLSGYKAAVASADIVITGRDIKYKGKSLKMAAPIYNWIEILGEPSRPRFNSHPGDTSSWYIWDNSGIICWSEGKSSQVVQVDIVFRKGGQFPEEYYAYNESKDPKFWPTNTYSSSILIDDAVINQNTPITYFNYNKKREKFNRGYLKTLYSTGEIEVRASAEECAAVKESNSDLDLTDIDSLKSFISYSIDIDYKKRVYSFNISYSCRNSRKE